MPPAVKSPEAILKALRRLDGNKLCPNCGHYNEFGYGSVCVKYKTFVCDLCKTSHQAISHRVKSLTMSTWTLEEVNELTDEMGGGNDAARHIWLQNAPNFGGRYNGGSRPKAGDRIEIFKKFVEDCYERGLFKASTPYQPAKESRPQTSTKLNAAIDNILVSSNKASVSNLPVPDPVISVAPAVESSLIDFGDTFAISSSNSHNTADNDFGFGCFQTSSRTPLAPVSNISTASVQAAHGFDNTWSEFVEASPGGTRRSQSFEPCVSSYSQHASIAPSPLAMTPSTSTASLQVLQQAPITSLTQSNHSLPDNSSNGSLAASFAAGTPDKNAAIASVLDMFNKTSISPTLPSAISRPMSANNISNMFGDIPTPAMQSSYHSSPMRAHTAAVPLPPQQQQQSYPQYPPPMSMGYGLPAPGTMGMPPVPPPPLQQQTAHYTQQSSMMPVMPLTVGNPYGMPVPMQAPAAVHQGYGIANVNSYPVNVISSSSYAPVNSYAFKQQQQQQSAPHSMSYTGGNGTSNSNGNINGNMNNPIMTQTKSATVAGGDQFNFVQNLMNK